MVYFCVLGDATSVLLQQVSAVVICLAKHEKSIIYVESVCLRKFYWQPCALKFAVLFVLWQSFRWDGSQLFLHQWRIKCVVGQGRPEYTTRHSFKHHIMASTPPGLHPVPDVGYKRLGRELGSSELLASSGRLLLLRLAGHFLKL
jgi:hypothetical protein